MSAEECQSTKKRVGEEQQSKQYLGVSWFIK